MDKNINDSGSHIRNSFLENIISGMQVFYIHRHVPVHIMRVSFLISNFLVESVKANKTSEKSLILQYSFAQKTSLILRTSTHLTLKIICSRNTAKSHSDFTNFSANMFLFDGRKKHLHCTISLRPRTASLKYFERKCLYISNSE